MASPSSSKYPITPSDSPPISIFEDPSDPPPISIFEHPSDPPPSSIPESFPYDVFLSFRGSDTRNNFTGHLYDRLVMAGIHTFMDDPELRRGKEISLQLMRAIEESRTYIVVFSQNYASSKWCLDELVKIMDCHEKSGRMVLPVFYRVEPSEVRWQVGHYKNSLMKYKKRMLEELNSRDPEKKWRAALTKAANLSGFDLQCSALGSESRLISMIIEEVLSQVKPKKLFVAKYPVGLDSRVSDVYSLMRHEPNYDVRLIGIWGMGGSGKTVTAKALYNKKFQYFDSSCFLSNVREVSGQQNGLLHLQEQLLSELLMTKNVNVCSVDRGIEMIRQRLCRKKVLIVLDDLDHLIQVDALVGHRDWFGHGSVIIITTRDQHLLNLVQVDGRYEAKELNTDESLELFCWHSFKKGFPDGHYALIAEKIVAYSCGLPLALEVLGAFLFGRTVQEWESTFESLHKGPPAGIQQILELSYIGLDDERREIFLDIACFFIGMKIEYVTDILNGCDFSAEIGIGILSDRCLLKVNRNNELRMHDLLRDMGRKIVKKTFPMDPGKRSRLWSHQDATNVLMKNMGTKAIKGITLVSKIEEEIHLQTENFAKMHRLRLLQMDNVTLDGSFKHLSKDIRWISWNDCSLKHLPSNFQMENLVVLDMLHSKMSTIWHGNQMSRLWQGNQFLRHLKILNLSHSKCLTSTPDFTRVPSLVTLILEDCTSLLRIHPSIGSLTSLLVLNLKGCEKITYIPSEVCSLSLLGSLNLSGCSKLRELPAKLGVSGSVRELYADETAITELPCTVGFNVNIMSLSLRGCLKISPKAKMFPFGQYVSPGNQNYALRRLNLRECNLSDEDIPHNVGSYCVLQELDLSGNRVNKLPPSFRVLTKLESLWLDNWSILQSIPRLPLNLEALVAKNIGASTEDLSDHQNLELPPNLEALVAKNIGASTEDLPDYQNMELGTCFSCLVHIKYISGFTLKLLMGFIAGTSSKIV